ncbi:hypothetical protein F1880_007644 [Penicillium rolfsii]|nr:hypothetical protein F1880_007644 [Penicillium rolfsii]
MDLLLEAVRDLPITVIDPTGDALLILSNRNFQSLFQCSSEKLIQACGLFRRRLAPSEQPHLELVRDGKVYLTIHEFYSTVVEHTLNLIHGCNENVPKDPSSTMVLEFAKFCDYLDCLPGMKPFTTIWMEKIKSHVLECRTLTPENSSWIFISYTFRDKEVFQSTTAVAQQNLDRKFDAKKLPIPKPIINRINKARQEYLHTLAQLLDGRKRSLSLDHTLCAAECNSLYLDLVCEISHKGFFPFDQAFTPKDAFTGYAPRVIRANLINLCRKNSKTLDRRCPEGKEQLCPHWRHPLGKDIEDHLPKFYSLLPGLDLPEEI